MFGHFQQLLVETFKNKSKTPGKEAAPPSLLSHFSWGLYNFMKYDHQRTLRLVVRDSLSCQMTTSRAPGNNSKVPGKPSDFEVILQTGAGAKKLPSGLLQPGTNQLKSGPQSLQHICESFQPPLMRNTHGICAQEENSPCCSDVLRNSRGKKFNDAFLPRVVKNDLLCKIGVRSSGEVLS